MNDSDRARAWFNLCDSGNGGVVPMPMNVAQLAGEFAKVRAETLADVLAELDAMHSSMSAYDAAVDLRQVYETGIERQATSSGSYPSG